MLAETNPAYLIAALLFLAIGCCLFISVRKNKALLKEKEALSLWHQSILDAMPYPVSVTDTDMNWTFVNKAMENFVKMKREDMLGRQCSTCNAPICKTSECGVARLKRGHKQTYFDFMGMSFFFWSNEGNEPIHIHVSRGAPSSNATKIRLRQNSQIELCHNNSKLSDKELAQAMEYIKFNYNSMIAAWYSHFGM